jgi:hypothetical protein
LLVVELATFSPDKVRHRNASGGFDGVELAPLFVLQFTRQRFNPTDQ